MSVLTKAQFAELLKWQTNKLSVYIKRGKIILVNDLINTETETNRLFLEKYMARDESQPSSETFTPPPPNSGGANSGEIKDPENLFSALGIPTYNESLRVLKYRDSLKREKEIEKLELENAKKRGEVIPSELVKPVFLQHNQSIITEFKNTTEEFLRVIAKKYSITGNDVAEYTGLFTTCINTAIKNATALTSKSVTNIIRDHSEKRGRGERTI